MDPRLRHRASAWLGRSAARLMTDARASEWVIRAIGTAQQGRELLADLQSAALHLTALPSRRDIHRLIRRTAALNRRLIDLERAVTRLEKALDPEAPPAQEPARPRPMRPVRAPDD